MRPLILVVTLLLAVTACGDDDADDTTDAACDAYVEVDRAFVVEEDPVAAIAALEDFAAAAPDDVSEPVEQFLAAHDAQGDAAFESEELATAESAADAWVFETCADETLDLGAHDFAYTGGATTIDAGRVAIRVTNQSESGEIHEAILLRKHDDVAASAHDALAAGLEQPISIESTFAALEPFDFLGVSFAEPDDADGDVFLVDLEEGEYLLACLFPENSTELFEPYAAGVPVDGNRHFDHGMYLELTVE